MINLQYEKLMKEIERLKGRGIVKVRYDMENNVVETVVFEQIWIKINPYNEEPTHILQKIILG